MTTKDSLSVDQLLALRAIGGVEAPQWSPDGEWLVFVSGLGGRPELWALHLPDGVLTQLTVGMGGVGHLATFMPQWSPSGDAIAYVSAKSGADELWLWPRDGGEATQLTCLGARIEAFSWSPDGRWLVVASNAYGTFDIFRVAVPDGKTTRLTRDGRNEVYPTVAPDGGHILYVRLNDAWTDHEVVSVAPDGDDPRVVLTDEDFFDYHYGRSFGYPLIAPDGKHFLFRSQRSGWTSIWVAPTDGNGSPRQIAPAEADQSDAAWSPDGRSIAYCENHNGTIDLRVVPLQGTREAGGASPRVLVAPEMGVCGGPAWSPDGFTISYLFGDLATPNDVWTVRVDDGTTRRWTDSMLGGGVRGRLIAPEKVAYRTFDGLDINAYLYRPSWEPGRRHPGIVWVHGGPTSQFLDTVQPQVQFFVAQGYVVLLPNIRGSTGYGRPFEDLNDHDWGGGDLQDVIAGAEYLKTLPDVDPDQLAVTGTSYGGIMAMMAVSFAPGVFQAAIPCSGYGDFVHMLGEQELRHIKLLEYELGQLPEDEAIYRKCSAIYRVADATTPCFVLHGEGRYPGSSASRDFALALEAHYKPFWYKSYPGETYYIASAANVKQQLRDMLAFFDFYLKG
jgi:dipeptidyl aminopeptidase/acylaminoacyl peptidase